MCILESQIFKVEESQLLPTALTQCKSCDHKVYRIQVH